MPSTLIQMGLGLNDGSDSSHVFISGAFPDYEFTVIRPDATITDARI